VTPNNADPQTRQRIAGLIVGLSIGGIALASAISIAFATNDTRPEMARLVFASVLPLLGTWVGTVLAFYFARENLQAATDTTIRLAGIADTTTPVSDVMIPRSQISAHKLNTGENAGTLTLGDLQNEMSIAHVRRIPILTESDAVNLVLHDSTIAKFADSVGKKPSDLLDETMHDLLAVPDLRSQVQAIGYVGPKADLGGARAAMGSVRGCNDVFVTEHGRSTDPVLGWLTNTQLAGLE
jgi:hypothetical protein